LPLIKEIIFQKILKIWKIQLALCCRQTGKSTNMNTVAYLLYLFLSYIITVHVGFRFYRNGRVYILALTDDDEKFTDFINRILLAGYYLLNLGYVALMIRRWPTLYSWTHVFSSVLYMTGCILLTLGVIHFLNMAIIGLISTNRNKYIHPKNN